MSVPGKQLEEWLREAEAAHAEYEKQPDRTDENWPAWYAQFIFNKMQGKDLESR